MRARLGLHSNKRGSGQFCQQTRAQEKDWGGERRGHTGQASNRLELGIGIGIGVQWNVPRARKREARREGLDQGRVVILVIFCDMNWRTVMDDGWWVSTKEVSRNPPSSRGAFWRKNEWVASLPPSFPLLPPPHLNCQSASTKSSGTIERPSARRPSVRVRALPPS